VIAETTDEYGRLYKRAVTEKSVAWDIFHQRETMYWTKTTNYQYNYHTDQLVLSDDCEEINRYQGLSAVFEQPRLESPNPQDLDFPVATFDNFAKFTRRGQLIWKYNSLTDKWVPTYEPHGEWEFEWLFYKRSGRLVHRKKIVYAIMYCPQTVPTKYEDWINDPLKLNKRPEFQRYANLGMDAMVRGTILPISMDTIDPTAVPYYDGYEDPRTVYEVVDERYEPITKRNYQRREMWRRLNETTGQWETGTTTTTMPLAEVPCCPMTPRMMNICSKNSYKMPIVMNLTKPGLSVSNSNIMTHEEADACRLAVTKRLVNAEYERTYTFPFPVYADRGWIVEFEAVNNYMGQPLLPRRTVSGGGVLKGFISSYNLTKANGSASTTITADGLIT
jgi:hypothetical protein